MARNEKVSMPSSQGGLIRYFDDYKSKIEFKPGYIILFVIFFIGIIQYRSLLISKKIKSYLLETFEHIILRQS